MKRHIERIEEQEKQAAAAVSQPAPSVPERTDSQGDGSSRSARRRVRFPPFPSIQLAVPRHRI